MRLCEMPLERWSKSGHQRHQLPSLLQPGATFLEPSLKLHLGLMPCSPPSSYVIEPASWWLEQGHLLGDLCFFGTSVGLAEAWKPLVAQGRRQGTVKEMQKPPKLQSRSEQALATVLR